MRIAILGSTRCIHDRRLALGLKDRGYDVRMVTMGPGELPGVEVERFEVPPLGWRHPVRWARRRDMQLCEIMRGNDVVHLSFLHDWGITPEIAGAGRLVVTPLGSDIIAPPELERIDEATVKVRRELLRSAAAVVVYGRWFAGVAARFAGLDQRVVVAVPLGVDPMFLGALPQRNPDRLVVGYFKGYRPVYGASVWIEAMPRVLRRFPRARFEMLGDGPERCACEALAEAVGVADSVDWLGYLPDERMPATIGGWSLTVMPSFSESYCVAALEAAAMQVPVVAGRVGGLLETVRDGVTGLLVPPGDADALSAAVTTLLEDEPRRRVMGRAGRDRVERDFRWEAGLDAIIDVYEQVLSRDAGSSCRHLQVAELDGVEDDRSAAVAETK